jgi:valyl-tRNA synthetase
MRGVSILDHVRALLAEKDLRDEQRYAAQTKAVETAMSAQQTAMRAALDAADKFNAMILSAQKEAVTKAEVAADKRFDLLNELRMGVATHEQMEALEKDVTRLREEVTGLRQRAVGVSASWAMMLGLGGLVITIVGVAVAIFVASR